jgi:hypothetical protein
MSTRSKTDFDSGKNDIVTIYTTPQELSKQRINITDNTSPRLTIRPDNNARVFAEFSRDSRDAIRNLRKESSQNYSAGAIGSFYAKKLER